MKLLDSLAKMTARLRPQPITDAGGLADFIDGNTAFLAQKTLYEYSRARAGTNWDKLFKEEEFRDAVDRGRWEAYAAVLPDVAEMVHAYLRTAPDADARTLAQTLSHMVQRDILPRHPVPSHLESWDVVAKVVEARLTQAAGNPPRMAHEIAMDGAKPVYDALPIHSNHTGHDYELIQNHLRFNLAQARSTLEERLDLRQRHIL